MELISTLNPLTPWILVLYMLILGFFIRVYNDYRAERRIICRRREAVKRIARENLKRKLYDVLELSRRSL